ncbi:hypothetical protein CLF_102195, partial [Clonorchis sinensis]
MHSKRSLTDKADDTALLGLDASKVRTPLNNLSISAPPLGTVCTCRMLNITARLDEIKPKFQHLTEKIHKILYPYISIGLSEYGRLGMLILRRDVSLSVTIMLYPEAVRLSALWVTDIAFSSMEICDYVRKNYGIELTGDDVRILRDKLRPLDHPVCDLQGIRDALHPLGPMAVSVCDYGSLKVLSFTSVRLRVGPQVLKDLENLGARLYKMEHEMSFLQNIQPIVCLLNPDATCDPATLEKASMLIDTIAVEICQRIECRHQVLAVNTPDRVPPEHTKAAILTACGMLDTTCTARWLRKLKPSTCCPIILMKTVLAYNLQTPLPNLSPYQAMPPGHLHATYLRSLFGSYLHRYLPHSGPVTDPVNIADHLNSYFASCYLLIPPNSNSLLTAASLQTPNGQGPLTKFLLANNAIDNRQYGFLSQRSVSGCQLHFFETITAAYDAGYSIVTVYLDIQKAFGQTNSLPVKLLPPYLTPNYPLTSPTNRFQCEFEFSDDTVSGQSVEDFLTCEAAAALFVLNYLLISFMNGVQTTSQSDEGPTCLSNTLRFAPYTDHPICMKKYLGPVSLEAPRIVVHKGSPKHMRLILKRALLPRLPRSFP